MFLSTVMLRNLGMLRVLLALCALSVVSVARADWVLDGESSRVSFVSSKSGSRAEVSRFLGLKGEVEADGQAQLRVELESVSSGIPKRDELLRKDLFEITRFPLALIGTRLDLPSLLNLAPGAQLELNVPLTVKLHGQASDHMVELLVTRLDEQRFQVVTLAPLVLQAEDYDLLPGLEKLRQLANLSHINSAVPVSAVLIFVNR